MKVNDEIRNAVSEVCSKYGQTEEFERMVIRLIENRMNNQPISNDIYDLIDKVVK